MKLNKPEILQLPKILDRRGNLTFIEGMNHIPFEIRRAFWIYDVPGGETRGGHAYKNSEEFIIALSGSFDVILDTVGEKTLHSLNRSYYGLYVPACTWRHMENFSTNSLALVLSSTFYNDVDYIRDYNDFINFRKQFFKSNIIDKHCKIKKLSYSNFKSNSINDCSRIDLNINHREKGNITVVENQITLPIDIQRVYYLYDIPGGESRGGHAHKEQFQFLIAASGSFDVVLDDGKRRKTVHLDRSYFGIYIVPGIWRELINFSSGSICLVLTSELYDEKEYLRNYEDFINLKNC